MGIMDGMRTWRQAKRHVRRWVWLALTLSLTPGLLPLVALGESTTGEEDPTSNAESAAQFETLSDNEEDVGEGLSAAAQLGTVDAPYLNEEGVIDYMQCYRIESADDLRAYCSIGSKQCDGIAIYGDFDIDTIELTCDTRAIVLPDGCRLGCKHLKMFHSLIVDGIDLDIYGQTEGTGSIVVSGDDQAQEATISITSFPQGAKVRMWGGRIQATANGEGCSAMQIDAGWTSRTGAVFEMHGGRVELASAHGDALACKGTVNVIDGYIKAEGRNGISAIHTNVSGGDVIANTNDSGAGITSDGMSPDDEAGSFTLSGGYVGASGSGDSAGIDMSGGSIDISGGDISASGDKGASIGSGAKGSGVTITISGGTVRAHGTSGAGIGSGEGADAASVTIEGSAYVANATSIWGAGIGGGMGTSGGTVTIKNGQIAEANSTIGAGIGGGQNGSGDTVTIMGGNTSAYSIKDPFQEVSFEGAGAAIGAGKDGNGFEVSITGGSVLAIAEGGAGIGDGENGNGGSVTINGGTIDADSATGACIGGANAGKPCTVTITGGDVRAGVGKKRGNTSGAGIGGGDGCKGGTVLISGGTVQAHSKYGGAGIGGGCEGSGGDVTITGGEVSAWVEDPNAQAIGHGAYASKSGSLTLAYPAEDAYGSVPARVWQGDVTGASSEQAIAVSADSDDRVDGCRGNYARITKCVHDGDTYLDQLDDTHHGTRCSLCTTVLSVENHVGASGATSACSVCGYVFQKEGGSNKEGQRDSDSAKGTSTTSQSDARGSSKSPSNTGTRGATKLPSTGDPAATMPIVAVVVCDALLIIASRQLRHT